MSDIVKQIKQEVQGQQFQDDLAIAQKSRVSAILLSLIFSPLAYFYLKRPWWGLLNLLTVNFFFLGVIVVPLHSLFIIDEARDRVQSMQPHLQLENTEKQTRSETHRKRTPQQDTADKKPITDTCPDCSEQLPDDAQFCPQCGHSVTELIITD